MIAGKLEKIIISVSKPLIIVISSGEFGGIVSKKFINHRFEQLQNKMGVLIQSYHLMNHFY